MAKRRSKSAASSHDLQAPGRRAKKKPLVQQRKPSGSATESLREEAERGWAKLDRQMVRRQQRELARTVQRANSKVIQKDLDRVKQKKRAVKDRA